MGESSRRSEEWSQNPLPFWPPSSAAFIKTVCPSVPRGSHNHLHPGQPRTPISPDHTWACFRRSNLNFLSTVKPPPLEMTALYVDALLDVASESYVLYYLLPLAMSFTVAPK